MLRTPKISHFHKKGFHDRRCRVFTENIGGPKKGLHVRRCVFTEYIGEDQKKSSLFEMRSFIFSEALGFSLPSLLVNPALSRAKQ